MPTLDAKTGKIATNTATQPTIGTASWLTSPSSSPGDPPPGPDYFRARCCDLQASPGQLEVHRRRRRLRVDVLLRRAAWIWAVTLPIALAAAHIPLVGAG